MSSDTEKNPVNEYHIEGMTPFDGFIDMYESANKVEFVSVDDKPVIVVWSGDRVGVFQINMMGEVPVGRMTRDQMRVIIEGLAKG